MKLEQTGFYHYYCFFREHKALRADESSYSISFSSYLLRIIRFVLEMKDSSQKFVSEWSSHVVN